MSRSAAKKYAKVLITGSSKENLDEIKDVFKAISTMFNEAKFKDTILSPLVTPEEKYELLISNKNGNIVLSNLIKLLIEKKRLELIPYIYEELRVAEAVEKKSFDGFIYTSVELDLATLEDVKNNISKKVDSKINFKQIKSDEEGFKIEVPDLGIEVSFSQDRVKSQLIGHILRGL